MDVLKELGEQYGISREKAEEYLETAWDCLSEEEKRKVSDKNPSADELVVIIRNYIEHVVE